MDNAFAGRTVLITGGASGIGAATALRLGAYGANVVVVDRSAGSELVAEAIRARGRAPWRSWRMSPTKRRSKR